MGTKTLLVMPIDMAGKCSHLVLISTLHEARDWPQEYVPRLRLLGEMLVNTVERARALDEVRRLSERLHEKTSTSGGRYKYVSGLRASLGGDRPFDAAWPWQNRSLPRIPLFFFWAKLAAERSGLRLTFTNVAGVANGRWSGLTARRSRQR